MDSRSKMAMPRGIQVTTNSPPHPGLSPRSSTRPQNTFLRRSLVERRVRIRCITFIKPENKDFVGIQHHDSSYAKSLVYHFENIHEWENMTPSIHVHIHMCVLDSPFSPKSQKTNPSMFAAPEEQIGSAKRVVGALIHTLRCYVSRIGRKTMHLAE